VFSPPNIVMFTMLFFMFEIWYVMLGRGRRFFLLGREGLCFHHLCYKSHFVLEKCDVL
jgi:hypothetical protein